MNVDRSTTRSARGSPGGLCPLGTNGPRRDFGGVRQREDSEVLGVGGPSEKWRGRVRWGFVSCMERGRRWGLVGRNRARIRDFLARGGGSRVFGARAGE